jgi:hypothetical protein
LISSDPNCFPRKEASYLTDGVNADVAIAEKLVAEPIDRHFCKNLIPLSLLGVGNHRLNEELAQDTGNVLNGDLLGGAGLNPLPSLSPGLVEGEEAGLASTLDQLIGLSDELGAGHEQPWVGDLGLVEDILDGLVFGEVEGGETRRRVVCGGRRERGRLDDGSASEVVVEDGLAVGLED